MVCRETKDNSEQKFYSVSNKAFQIQIGNLY